MKRFKTLLWLEHRRSWVWAVSLLGSLAFWAWGIQQVRATDFLGERLTICVWLLAIAAAIGVVVLCLMSGRIRSETRHGQYEALLLTPPSGYAHLGARYLYAAGVGFIYYVAIGLLCWWSFTLAGFHFDARTSVELVVAVPLYAMSVSVLPLLAWTLLLMVFVSAYRVSGPGWVPGTVMLAGTPFAFRWLARGMWSILYKLPGWRLLADMPAGVPEQTAGPFRWESVFQFDPTAYQGFPLEPPLILLGLSAALLVLAGRIWQEVEA